MTSTGPPPGRPVDIPVTFRAYGARGGAMAAFLQRLPGLLREISTTGS
jgi:hypothetical protein